MKNLLKKLKNKKGFTLAELLIVVAIIAVLVAISIPIFNSQLEKSRDAVSVANMRAAYAEAQTAYLTGASGGNATYTAATTSDSAKVEVANVVIKSQKGDDWNSLDEELPFVDAAGAKIDVADPGEAGTYKMTFTYDENGAFEKITLTK